MLDWSAGDGQPFYKCPAKCNDPEHCAWHYCREGFAMKKWIKAFDDNAERQNVTVQFSNMRTRRSFMAGEWIVPFQGECYSPNPSTIHNYAATAYMWNANGFGNVLQVDEDAFVDGYAHKFAVNLVHRSKDVANCSPVIGWEQNGKPLVIVAARIDLKPDTLLSMDFNTYDGSVATIQERFNDLVDRYNRQALQTPGPEQPE